MLGLGLSLPEAAARGPGTGGAAPAALRPLSYVKAIPNEYNAGAGLGAGNKAVGGTCHFVIYDDVADGSFEIRFWHGAASAGQGEWNTGGTMTVACSLIWIDAAGSLQITTLNGAGSVPSAAPFGETIHRHPGIRPKIGSHAWLNYKATFANSGYYSHGRADYAQGEALQYGASVPDYVGATTPYGNSWSGGGDFWGPCFVGWSGGNLSRPCFAISGDSNHSGLYAAGTQSDVPDTLQGGIGSVARLLTPNMAGIDISIPGATASEMSDPTKTIHRDRLIKGRSNVLFAPLGTNDVIFQGATEATLNANLNTYASRLGIARVFLPTIPPVVTSAASNTVRDAARDPARRSRNASLRALGNVLDIAIGVESLGSPGTLQVLGDTIDGTHFNATGNKRAAAGAGFNVATKIPGAAPVDAGFQYAAGPIYQSLRLDDGWAGQQAALTDRVLYSPEHKLTAATIREDGAAGASHGAFKQLTMALAGTTKTFTFFVKRAAGARNLFFQIQRTDTWGDARSVINLGTGTVIYNNAHAGFTVNNVTITGYDDYLKVAMSVSFAAGVAANPYVFFKLADAAGTDGYNGDGTSSIAVWGLDVR